MTKDGGLQGRGGRSTAGRDRSGRGCSGKGCRRRDDDDASLNAIHRNASLVNTAHADAQDKREADVEKASLRDVFLPFEFP
jgi:hypothetical protein